jgi:TolB protein
MVGDSVSITATIKNIGDIAGTYTATPSIDGQVIDSRDISIPAGQSSIAEFTLNNLAIGKHDIAIGESAISIDVSPKQTRIAFVRDFGDFYKWDICTANSDGTDIERITNSPSDDWWPSWSPDGTKVAFQSTREWYGNPSIYVMDTGGQNTKCLTSEVVANCQFPAWSPDGSKIAYSTSKLASSTEPSETRHLDVFIMDTNGKNKTPVSPVGRIGPTAGVRQVCPSWFPNSQRIAFASNFTGHWEICSTNTDGTDSRRVNICVTPNSCGLYFPQGERNQMDFPILAVSPDETTIAFDYCNPNSKRRDILTIDSGELKNLTGGLVGNSYFPTWSPDGSKIAFTLEKDGNTDIYTINADGSNPTLLIENGMYPSWQR